MLKPGRNKIRTLQDLLRDEDKEIRKTAQEIQARIGDNDVVQYLIDVILTSNDIHERFEAGELLGILGDPRLEGDNFIEIPAGTYLRGSKEGEGYKRESPQREIYLDTFGIGKYPVTNQEFRKFVNEKGYGNQDHWSSEGWVWRETNKITEPRYWHNRKWNKDNFPVVGICWYEAEAYANWFSRETGMEYRLPTEAEWEKAARGTDRRRYPWGNDIDQTICNFNETGLDRTSPVGIFPGSESPYGCVDMAGNVWEWCSDWFRSDYYKVGSDRNPQGPDDSFVRVLRGGCWGFSRIACLATNRLCFRPDVRISGVGFRLARSSPTGRA